MNQNQNQNHQEDFDDDDDFTWALCPISLSPMADPVMTPSGHSFEREAIEDWLSTNGTNPMTNEALNKRQLIPNRCLHDAIEAWKKRNADWEERIASIKEDLLAKNEQQNNANGDEELKRRLKDFKAALEFQKSRQVFARRKLDGRKTSSWHGQVKNVLRQLFALFPAQFDTAVREEIVKGMAGHLDDNFELTLPTFEALLQNQALTSDRKTQAWLLTQAGLAYHAKGKVNNDEQAVVAAIEKFETAILLDPRLAEAHRMLGWEKDRLIQHQTPDPAQKKELLEEIIEHYETSIKLDNKNPIAFDGLARALRTYGNPARACIEFKRGIDLEPTMSKSMTSLAETLRDMDQFDEATQWIEAAMRASPNCDLAFRKAGVHYKKLFFRARSNGDASEAAAFKATAIRHFEKSLQIEDNEQTRETLKRLKSSGRSSLSSSSPSSSSSSSSSSSFSPYSQKQKPNAQKKLCFSFKNTGKCRFGNKCHYRH